MGSSKGGGDDWGKFFGILIGVGLGAVALYYIQAGRGEENDAALIPDDLEGRIDLVVKKLNGRFDKAWVNFGLDAIELYLKAILPWEVVRLVSAIYQVEQLSRTTQMNGHAKQQTAADWIRRGITSRP
jgi:hypothetical protein